MRELLGETELNARAFARDYMAQLAAAHGDLVAHEAEMVSGYRAAVTLQAWRVLLLERLYTPAARDFLLEAQNDALQSFVLAHMGLWRPALQSCRASIEGVLAAEYYADHAIEFILWQRGKHRLSFTEYKGYFSAHPAGIRAEQSIDPLCKLDHEYGELSRAVHGSSLPYRMSHSGALTISTTNFASHAQWLQRHTNTICALNLLLMSIHRDQLQGACLRSLRKSISLGVPPALHGKIRSAWGVRLFT